MAGAWLCGIGMVTPVGGCSLQTAASVRAGMSAYAECSVHNKKQQPMTMALVPDDLLPPLEEEVAGQDGLTSRQIRMLRLAHLAMGEAVANLPDDDAQSLPLFLAVPEKLPGRAHFVEGRFVNRLASQSGLSIDLQNSRLVNAGRSAGMVALRLALELLESGSHDFVLLGGVDTHLDLYHLACLDKEERLLGEGVMDGFVPGEGAGFLLLCSEQARDRMPERPLLRLHTPGIARENGHRYSEEPYTGDGMADAVRAALQAADCGPVCSVFSSINGENFGAKEWGVAYTRNQAGLYPEFRFEHPAECFGDTGAAAMPLLTGLAAIGIRQGYVASPAMSVCSSEGKYRGAVCISTSEN